MTNKCARIAAFLFFVFTQAHALMAQPSQSVPSSLAGETLRISRATGPIKVDGNLSDEGWQSIQPLTTWYEVNPGDNTPPKVRNVGYLTYDDKFFYAGFEFQDPEPSKIRAPLGDRDNVPSTTDYGGVILDTRNDG